MVVVFRDVCRLTDDSRRTLDNSTMIRNGSTGDWLGTYEGHRGAVWSVNVSHDGRHILTGSADCTVYHLFCAFPVYVVHTSLTLFCFAFSLCADGSGE